LNAGGIVHILAMVQYTFEAGAIFKELIGPGKAAMLKHEMSLAFEKLSKAILLKNR